MPTNLLSLLSALPSDSLVEGAVVNVETTGGEKFAITFGPRVPAES